MKQRFLVTGVSSGIGKEITKNLIRDGFQVFGVARRRKHLKELSGELRSKRFRFVAGDISDDKFRKQMISSMKDNKFAPDIVILNAAIFGNDFTEKGIDTQYTRKIFEVNFFAN